ncbi:Ornithine decarboxylase [Takifugu flavidus]|uniref:Ornithine decarboxylase n=1 Tax=Takifugu flavidus TaxID=433684 RepID=A0A5C6ME56_9TELE|nr:Ornithine decarboxylase [Takifugu flavidus]
MALRWGPGLYTVEEVAPAVGEVIGHGSVKSAARMNGAVVVFVEKVEQVNRLVEAGISVGGRFEVVLPLSQLATKVTLSNVPPFITDEFLCRELSRHGKIVSPMRKVMSGSKSAASGSGERPGAAAAEPRTAEPGAAGERSVAGAEGPGDDGATTPVGSDGNTGEGEQEGKTGGVCEEVGDTGGTSVQGDEADEMGVQEGEVGEEEELGCNGAAEAVELMEQEAVSDQCLFCPGRETVFHAYKVPERLMMYYLSDGVFGSLHFLLINGQVSPYLHRAVESSEKRYRSVIWGPTCDYIDKIVDNYLVPELHVGDWLLIDNIGAYGISMSTEFNGFERSSIYSVVTNETWHTVILSSQ